MFSIAQSVHHFVVAIIHVYSKLDGHTISVNKKNNLLKSRHHFSFSFVVTCIYPCQNLKHTTSIGTHEINGIKSIPQ